MNEQQGGAGFGKNFFSGKLPVFILCLIWAFFLCSGVSWGMGKKPARYHVGVRSLAAMTPDHARLGVMVWYPASGKARRLSTGFGSWRVNGGWNIRPANLSSPVILLSHDMVDNSLAYHELASALASAGFVVIVPTHTGDNSQNSSSVYSAASLYYRPLQLHEALAAVLGEKDFAGRLDTDRIGLLGSGSGALTALQLCGVDLDYDAYSRYCAETPDDETLCSRWAMSRMDRMQPDMESIRSKYGRRAFAAPLANVKAVGLLSPGWLGLANKSEVASLRVPLAALFAGQGGLYPPVTSGEDVLRMFPGPFYDSVSYQVLPDVDHYSLRSECPADILADVPELCGRLHGPARSRLREKRDAYFVAYFQAALGEALPMPEDAK